MPLSKKNYKTKKLTFLLTIELYGVISRVSLAAFKTMITKKDYFSEDSFFFFVLFCVVFTTIRI